MEVHVNGLPPFLSHDALQKRLEPIMATLGIGPTDFTTDKPKKSKWAHVAFLNPSHGASFLRKYGEQWVPAKNSGRASANGPVKNNVRKARLQLMGNDIYCTASKRASPEPITLRALQYATEEQRNPTRKVETDGAPERFRLRAISCGLNSFHGESDQLMFTPQVEYRNITNAVAKFSKRLLLIKWQQAGEGLILATQKIMRIPMDTVLSLVYSRPDRLNLTLIEEPSFCEEQCDLPSLLSSLGFNDRSRAEPKRNRVCHLDQKHAKVVGHCLVYQLELSEPQNLTALEHHPVTPLVRYDLAPGPIHAESSDVSMRALKDQLIDYTRTAELPFDIMYQLQSLAWNAYLEPRTVSALAKKLKNVYKRDKISISGTQRVTAQALQRLRKELDWPLPFGDPSVFRVESILTYLMEKQKEIRQETATGRKSKPPTRQALVYRITVTPTRITLHGPELEAKNRILRKFEDRHEFFARVQFCDENGQNLFFNGKIDHSKIFERYKRVLDQGIQVAGRVYSFLGFSNSSLRSHSCWFSAPFVDRDGKHQSYNVILRELGDFSSIRSPARLAARIGQAFSETPYSVSLVERDIVKTIPDVESSGKSRVFSDGVGTISQEIVHRIWDVLPITKAAPTAFQIRLQGAKGMLALDSRLPASLPLVRLRPSMIKFPSQERKVLEICDTASKPIPLYLNRQMIKILEDMGVKDAWFFKMQGIMLSQLRAVTDSTYNVARFLKQQNVGEALRLHRLFRQLENMGIDYRKDPFLTSVVEASLLRELRLLKHKARIRIGDGGVTLFGIMDETGYLKEGEVHVSYDMMNSRFSPPPEEGAKLVVTRSPALHPGDIQLAVQKIPPEGHPLRQHHNVIVFSQHGERDLPSQLSGGDLDGDIYNVIWDVEAMPLRVFEPADYPRVAPLELGRKVEKDDILNFFIEFMRLDHLGVIATRHMILADQRELGTLDQDCLKLAELHSLAADYPKSGRAASLASLPRAPRYRPDFFAPGPEAHIVDKSEIELDEYVLEPAFDEDEEAFSNPPHKYYRSNKILGKLYRAVNEQEIWRDQIHRNRGHRLELASEPPFWDQFLSITTRRYEVVVPFTERRAWASRVYTALELKRDYNNGVADLMIQFSEHPIKPITELEVFIGNIMNRSSGGVQTSRQRDNSIKLKEDFDQVAAWVARSMRNVRPDVEPTGYQSEFDNLHLCMACVRVGGEKENSGTEHGGYFANLQSFRIVAACALLAELNLFSGGSGGGGYVGLRG